MAAPSEALASLQHREITPDDYDLLLALSAAEAESRGGFALPSAPRSSGLVATAASSGAMGRGLSRSRSGGGGGGAVGGGGSNVSLTSRLVAYDVEEVAPLVAELNEIEDLRREEKRAREEARAPPSLVAGTGMGASTRPQGREPVPRLGPGGGAAALRIGRQQGQQGQQQQQQQQQQACSSSTGSGGGGGGGAAFGGGVCRPWQQGGASVGRIAERDRIAEENRRASSGVGFESLGLSGVAVGGGGYSGGGSSCNSSGGVCGVCENGFGVRGGGAGGSIGISGGGGGGGGRVGSRGAARELIRMPPLLLVRRRPAPCNEARWLPICCGEGGDAAPSGGHQRHRGWRRRRRRWRWW